MVWLATYTDYSVKNTVGCIRPSSEANPLRVNKGKKLVEKVRNPKTEKCPFCENYYQKQNIHKHIISCNPKSNETNKAAWNKGIKTGSYQKHQLFVCKFCHKEWITTKSAYTLHENCCEFNPNRYIRRNFGTHRTTEEKKKISEGQKLAHKEGRNSSWIGRRKRSYAEEYWYNVFINTLGESNFENNYPVKNNNSSYFLDFAWPERKIYFEVDGESHYSELGVQKDEKRTKFLESMGWTLIGRCRWSKFQKLTTSDKETYINHIIKQVKENNRK